jgi:hypothetical protein
MPVPSLNRPPRAKRPSEVVRHVDATFDAYRRMVAARKGAEETAPAPKPDARPRRP